MHGTHVKKKHFNLFFKARTHCNATVLFTPRPPIGLLLWNFPTDFAEYNQQDATFHNLFISVRRSTYFRRFYRPSSGAQNCPYGVRYLSDQYLTMYGQFWALDDERQNRLKHAERLTEINKLWNVASCWFTVRIYILLHKIIHHATFMDSTKKLIWRSFINQIKPRWTNTAYYKVDLT
jgi:hypothetical protein